MRTYEFKGITNPKFIASGFAIRWNEGVCFSKISL